MLREADIVADDVLAGTKVSVGVMVACAKKSGKDLDTRSCSEVHPYQQTQVQPTVH